MTALSDRPARRHSVTSISSWAYPPPVCGRVIVSGSAPARCSTIVCGWWKRGRTSIQPVVPKTRAWTGQRLAQRGGEGGRPPVAVVEQQGGLRVGAGGEQRSGGHHALRRPEQHLGEGDDVDAEVEQRTAAEGEVEEPVRRVVLPGDAEVGLHGAHLTDGAVGDQLPHGDDGRLEAGPHRLHHEDAGAARQVDHLGGAGRGRGERLLHQQGLARAQGGDRDRVVLGVGRRDVEDVDVRVGQDLGVGAVRRARSRAGRRTPPRGLRDREATATARAPSTSGGSPATTLSAMRPGPTMPQRISSCTVRSTPLAGRRVGHVRRPPSVASCRVGELPPAAARS